MRTRSLSLCVMIMFVCVFAFWGCPKKAEMTTTPEAPQEEAPVAEQEKPDQQAEDARRAAEEAEAAKAKEEQEAQERAAAGATGLQPVYFDFDKSFIRGDAQAIMKANAEWLRANPKTKVRIEGHADEKGTIEYNQALGQRRAASARKYLTDLGISASRIALISYGKEKPVCTESDEECWQKNRRAEFVAE